MRKLQEDIQELCPNGVEYRNLGDVVQFRRGTSITRQETSYGEIPVVAGGQKPSYFHSVANRDGETITVAGSGAYAGFVNFWRQPIFVSDAFTVEPDLSLLIPRFVYHFLKNLQDEIHMKKTGGGIPHVYGKDLANFRIPIPPISIQLSVIEKLDAFTELEAELEAELGERRKQYHFYRDMLLGPNDQTGTKWFTVSDLFDLRNGYTPDKSNLSFWEGGSIPWFRVEDIRENGRRLSDSKQKITPDAVKTGKLFEAGNLLISTSAAVGEFAVISVPHLANQRFISLGLKNQYSDEVESKYLYYLGYLIARHALEHASTSGNFPAISNSQLSKLALPIPSKERQLKISDQLDLFDELVNSSETGLPAELVARRKQYEYCRDKLLTFKELAA